MKMQLDDLNLSRLYELLDQDQFELLPPFDTGRIRLVYLMNDAVESFLVFEDATLTGTYQEGFEGVPEAELRLDEDGRYVLIVHQDKTVCTIFFRSLSLDVKLYDYGKTGHVWVKGHEELRQLEYWIAIMNAKRVYLGEEYCSDEERKLAELAAFPPLNCCSYPAVPRKYEEVGPESWIPSAEGIETMRHFAEKAGDRSLVRKLKLYKHFHGRRNTKALARLFKRNSHTAVVRLLLESVIRAAAAYPERVFEGEEAAYFQRVTERAERRREVLRKNGRTVYLISQLPFVEVRDEVDFKVHLVIWEKGFRNRRVSVETFPET
ncbi:MAG: DUF3878 family protein [Lachnospiraceae bacterium]|nr:DUF3878 family protein [Lachnospiraceae bacterium]